MIGFVKKSTFIAIVLLSASVAYAGDLRPAPSGGNSIHPDPLHGKDNAMTHATNDTATAAISKEKEDKLRRLRPVK
jgi:hypothetical protein